MRTLSDEGGGAGTGEAIMGALGVGPAGEGVRTGEAIAGGLAPPAAGCADGAGEGVCASRHAAGHTKNTLRKKLISL